MRAWVRNKNNIQLSYTGGGSSFLTQSIAQSHRLLHNVTNPLDREISSMNFNKGIHDHRFSCIIVDANDDMSASYYIFLNIKLNINRSPLYCDILQCSF